MDEVDRIVAAWRHERPDLDVSPMEILSRVSRLARQLDLARKTSFSDYGIEGWAFDVLSALRRSGEPYQLSPSTLLQETLVTSGTMTNRIDRLVARGWVERRPDPGDRRGVLVQLTDSGRATVDSALADLLVKERAILSGLTPAGSRKLASRLRDLATGCDRDEEGPTVAQPPDHRADDDEGGNHDDRFQRRTAASAGQDPGSLGRPRTAGPDSARRQSLRRGLRARRNRGAVPIPAADPADGPGGLRCLDR